MHWIQSLFNLVLKLIIEYLSTYSTQLVCSFWGCVPCNSWRRCRGSHSWSLGFRRILALFLKNNWLRLRSLIIIYRCAIRPLWASLLDVLCALQALRRTRNILNFDTATSLTSTFVVWESDHSSWRLCASKVLRLVENHLLLLLRKRRWIKAAQLSINLSKLCILLCLINHGGVEFNLYLLNICFVLILSPFEGFRLLLLLLLNNEIGVHIRYLWRLLGKSVVF